MQLSLNFLGEYQIFANEALATFATNQARALLVYLAVESARAHRRESLADLLWPDDRAAAARQNLSQTLLRVRQAIGDLSLDKSLSAPPIFQITRQTLQLKLAEPMVNVVAADVVTVDVLEFQALLAVCMDHSHVAMSQCPACCQRLIQAIDLVRGPFLEDFPAINSTPFEEWVLVIREQLQRQMLDALHTLTVHYAAAGNQPQAQQFAARQLQIEPWREAAHRQLMLALAHNGQRSAALAQYESCRRLLADELAVEPEAETVALAEEVRRGEHYAKMTGWQDEKPSAAHPVTPSSLQQRIRTRLEPQHDQQLFGVGTARARIQALLQAEARPWIIALDGIGGIGKTTLATALAYDFIESGRFVDIGWVSAKQEEFQPAAGVQSTGRPALDSATFTDVLLMQLLEQPPLTAIPQEKTRILQQLLKAQPHLIVVDNLESVRDLDALTPYLRELANPTKFLLTTRFSLRTHAEIYSHTLRELSEADTLALLRHEANARGMAALGKATPAELAAIYAVVGGNPLALKLVVGQLGFLSLPQVLTNLAEARGKRVDELYTYIYWQAWQLLNEDERQLFLTMPLAPNATFDQLALVSALAEEPLQTALTHLIERSLVQVAGDLSERRYRLHRLTETFLMNEVLKWQSMA